jgi:transcriptional regulator with XRE-family HTH domain
MKVTRLNEKLKVAILSSPWKQFRLAEAAGIGENRLSKIVGGHAKATRGERERLAEVLQVRVEELFSSKEKESVESVSSLP